MFKRNKIKPADPPKITATRVLLLTLPMAAILATLVWAGSLDYIAALASYLLILFISLALMAGFMSDLQSLVDYAKDVSEGKTVDSPKLSSHDTETSEIIKSINKIRNVWMDEGASNQLSISDAAVLDTIPDPLLFLDDNLNITGANLNSYKLLGSTIAEKNIYSIFPNEYFENKFHQIISGKETEIKFEYKTYDVPVKYLMINIVKLPAKAKTGAQIMLSINDITLQKTIEKKQIEFFANASHELKTPLSVISGFVETIQTSAKDDAKATDDFLNIIKNQAEEMTHLINNLLSISRIESGVIEKNITKVMIFTLVNKIEDRLSLKATEKSVKFKKDIEKDLFICADEKQIIQIFTNLMDNAIKYGQEKTAINIIAKNIKNGIEISINNKTDNHINEDELDNISQRFFRTSDTKKKKIPGTGLGLSIVKSIVKSYNGDMKISYDIKSGMTFVMQIYNEKLN